ncbi:succinate dehydrogenase [Thioalkalivibrio sp. HK1]|uniref:succinate dehydrogenase n=1 Tax=Thioalkalivibrio sp. HK1 TaxID=1469245 RepID=UPI00046F3968
MTPLAFVLQRLSALVMVPVVIVHLGLVIYAVRGGLSAGEILGRTQGSVAWGLFYTLFVVSVALHAGLGLRNILDEWTALNRGATAAIAHLFVVLTLLLGLRAVFAVTVS